MFFFFTEELLNREEIQKREILRVDFITNRLLVSIKFYTTFVRLEYKDLGNGPRVMASRTVEPGKPIHRSETYNSQFLKARVKKMDQDVERNKSEVKM